MHTSIYGKRRDQSESASGEGPSRDRFADPVAFVREVLGEEPYDKQTEMLGAARGARRVSIVGCNGSGKDWAAAPLVLWCVHSRSPAKAIVTGPTTRQVDDIVWKEMRMAYNRAPDLLGGRMFRTSRYEVDEQTFALGFATDSPYNIQGFHSPNLLVVITEAHAVHEDQINAIRRLHPARLVMTGNPFVNAGTFYDSHHSRRHIYSTVQIGASDTPTIKQQKTVVPGMITQEDIDDRREEWGEETGFTVLGCDVARFGHDKTVVIRRQGPVARIVWRVRGNDTMRIAGFLKAYCEEHLVESVVVDDTGVVGGGVVDRLREVRLTRTRIVPFIGGQRAEDEAHFANRLAEVWWAMRNGYRSRDLDTDDDPALIGQVSSRKFWWDSKGRIVLQSKERMHRSPDEADALAMTFVVHRGGMQIWV